ncbi:hypothetical protein OPT61_g8884 [Boeremia exigua]|uniref:Uncharacterized protein n=1 Tax=Boeremia exigua TaxID=749465 RepID=A0ACC2HWE8_9PLEO|nr:hypothetical protein OPT61_g8884 [Boeremia exigua]
MLSGQSTAAGGGLQLSNRGEYFGAGRAVSMVQTSALARRDATQREESKATIGRACRVYEERQVAQGAACSAKWALGSEHGFEAQAGADGTQAQCKRRSKIAEPSGLAGALDTVAVRDAGGARGINGVQLAQQGDQQLTRYSYTTGFCKHSLIFVHRHPSLVSLGFEKPHILLASIRRLKPAMTSTLGRFRVSAPPLYLVAGASLGGLLFLRHVSSSLRADKFRSLASPRETSLLQLSGDELERLPYPPDALPGARDVDSPYGSIRVYEWGPEDGEKILLVHGISTPSIALGNLAHKLAENGCRVMLFDLFCRGYSSGPSPHTHRYDSSLYTSQIHICLSSSPMHWSRFSIVGYSLGGALAADFASYFPQLIRGLVLVAPGGLIRRTHTTWKSRVLYNTSGLLPESWVESLVAKRLFTGPEVARSIEPEADGVENAETRKTSRGDAVYASSHHALLPANPYSTVGAVVDWQIEQHKGFVPAFISSIRYAPVHGEHDRWRILGENITRGVGGLKKVHIVLGETDPIIVKDEIIEDASECLGDENVEFEVVEGIGHEVAIERASDIVRVVGKALEKW